MEVARTVLRGRRRSNAPSLPGESPKRFRVSCVNGAATRPRSRSLESRMLGNGHVRFGGGLRGKGPAHCRHLAAQPTLRPEPVTLGLEPGLPLGLQPVPDPTLMAAVRDHGDTQRTQFCTVTSLRYIHPPNAVSY